MRAAASHWTFDQPMPRRVKTTTLPMMVMVYLTRVLKAKRAPASRVVRRLRVISMTPGRFRARTMVTAVARIASRRSQRVSGWPWSGVVRPGGRTLRSRAGDWRGGFGARPLSIGLGCRRGFARFRDHADAGGRVVDGLEELDLRQELDSLQHLKHGQSIRPDASRVRRPGSRSWRNERGGVVCFSAVSSSRSWVSDVASISPVEKQSIPPDRPRTMNQTTSHHHYGRHQKGSEHLVGQEQAREVVAENSEDAPARWWLG